MAVNPRARGLRFRKDDGAVINGSHGAVNVTLRNHKWVLRGEVAMPRTSIGMLSAVLILGVLFG